MNESPDDNRPPLNPAHVETASRLISAMKTEIGHAIAGQQDSIELVLIALFASGHVLIEGVPGLGKTLLVRALGKTFGGSFGRIQFTPDLMPADVTGHALFDLKSQEFKTRRGPVFCHLLLADEINRAPAKTQAALLEAMQERQVTIEGSSEVLPSPFMVLATQNPIEQEGTYPLPEAELDRFLFKIKIDYGSQADESDIVRRVTLGKSGDGLDVAAVNTIASAEHVLAVQKVAAHVRVEDRVIDYAVRISRATRTWPGLSFGAGPRASIAMVRAARIVALLAGRDFVTADDVKRIALPVLRHRIQLSADAELEGRRDDGIVEDILAATAAPRE
jgi:MoxR-like ATPase